ncbi:MAG: CHASE2 domain-containing protein, partial [Pseudomonadota bacterium]
MAAIIFGLIGAGELPEDMLRASRNSLHQHKATGDIVLVAIDDRSLREVGRWPWPRSRHAEIINKLSQAGANRTFVDIVFNGRSDSTDDAKLADAVSNARNVTLAVSTRSGITRTGITGSGDPDLLPPEMFSKHAELGLISVAYNYQNAVWHLDYSRKVQGKAVQ